MTTHSLVRQIAVHAPSLWVEPVVLVELAEGQTAGPATMAAVLEYADKVKGRVVERRVRTDITMTKWEPYT